MGAYMYIYTKHYGGAWGLSRYCILTLFPRVLWAWWFIYKHRLPIPLRDCIGARVGIGTWLRSTRKDSFRGKDTYSSSRCND